MRRRTILQAADGATAEDIANNGPLVADVASVLPEWSTVHDKMVFGLTTRSIASAITLRQRIAPALDNCMTTISP